MIALNRRTKIFLSKEPADMRLLLPTNRFLNLRKDCEELVHYFL